MQGEKALAACRELIATNTLTHTEMAALLRALHNRSDDGAKGLVAELATLRPDCCGLRARPGHTDDQPDQSQVLPAGPQPG